jgi:hypothetical protein
VTTPSQVRAGLTLVTTAAVADTRTVAEAGRTPAEVRAALFAAAPLIVADYGDGSAALALDWYEELRDEAAPRRPFTPRPLAVVREEELASSVAWATEALYDLERDVARITEELLAEATQQSLTLLEPVIQKDVAAGFRDTVTGNVAVDPEALGWQRFTSSGACGFCRMLADRGAVYTEATVDFAAHTDCHCVCGPSYDPDAPKADVMQYVASAKNRTAAQQAVLREYLNKNYPDSPG